jgi:predicted acyltransferase
MNQKRLLSIDTLRGFDMMFIMGFAALVKATCELFPGGGDCWLFTQMTHVDWNGFRHHDTIFPLFLFISGMTFPFSMSARLERGASRKRIFWHTVLRGVILCLFGLLFNKIQDFKPDFRIPSVLARIGLAWMFAAWIYMACGWKWRAVIASAILIGYNLLLLIPAPDAAGAGSLTLNGNIVGYVDRTLIPNHIYIKGVFDPEGLLSTLPAIVTALLGQFTGEFVRTSDKSHKTLRLLCAAAILLIAGLVWNCWFPVNKKLWSSSFVLVVGAYSVALFAIFHWLIDVKGYTRWTGFFTVIGMNSITIYLAQRIIPFKNIAEFFFGGLAGLLPEVWGKWILSLAYFAISWLFLLFLKKKQVFLKV